MATPLGRLSPDELASAAPVAKPGTLGQLSPGDLSTAAPAVWDRPQAPEPGIGETVARAAEQGVTLGFGDEINAALEAATSGKSYVQARTESRAAFDAAKEAHPFIYGATELAAGAAPMLLPGGAIAKAVGLGGKAVEAASAGRIGAEVAKDVAAGIGLGGLSSAGNSEAGYQSEAGGFGQLAKDTAEGAAFGGALSAAGGAVARKLTREAPQRALGDLGQEISGNAPAKFAKKVSQDIEDIQATLAQPENAKIASNLDNTNKALPHVSKRMTTVGEELDRLKTQLDDELTTTVYKAKSTSNASPNVGEPPSRLALPPAEETALARREVEYRPRRPEAPAERPTIEMSPETIRGGAKLGTVIKPLENQLEELSTQPGNGAYRRALREMIDDVRESWSPKVNGVAKYDPETVISTKDLRAYTTNVQRAASNTMGQINESLASELKHDLASTMKTVMDAHLDVSAQASPKAAEIVGRMRQLNTEYSALANVDDALRARLWKDTTKRVGLGARLKEQANNLGITAGVGAIASGHPEVALAIAGAKLAGAGVDAASKAANQWLSRMIRAAAAGSARAQVIQMGIESGAPRAVAEFIANKLAASKQ